MKRRFVLLIILFVIAGISPSVADISLPSSRSLIYEVVSDIQYTTSEYTVKLQIVTYVSAYITYTDVIDIFTTLQVYQLSNNFEFANGSLADPSERGLEYSVGFAGHQFRDIEATSANFTETVDASDFKVSHRTYPHEGRNVYYFVEFPIGQYFRLSMIPRWAGYYHSYFYYSDHNSIRQNNELVVNADGYLKNFTISEPDEAMVLNLDTYSSSWFVQTNRSEIHQFHPEGYLEYSKYDFRYQYTNSLYEGWSTIELLDTMEIEPSTSNQTDTIHTSPSNAPVVQVRILFPVIVITLIAIERLRSRIKY